MAKHIGEGVNITADALLQWDNGAAGSAGLTYDTTDSEFQFDTNVEVQGNLNVTGDISGNITDVDFGDITADSISVDTGDLTFTNADKGVVLKDTQGTPHNWRITVNNDGKLQTSDLGAA